MRRLNSRQAVDDLRLQCFYGEQRNESNHGPDLMEMLFAVRSAARRSKTVGVVPQRSAVGAHVVHGVAMFTKCSKNLLATSSYAGSSSPAPGQSPACSGNNAHPAGAVGLFEMAAVGNGADRFNTPYVQAQNPPGISSSDLSVTHPGEVQQQL